MMMIMMMLLMLQTPKWFCWEGPCTPGLPCQLACGDPESRQSPRCFQPHLLCPSCWPLSCASSACCLSLLCRSSNTGPAWMRPVILTNTPSRLSWFRKGSPVPKPLRMVLKHHPNFRFLVSLSILAALKKIRLPPE